jgi:hypothetical protein
VVRYDRDAKSDALGVPGAVHLCQRVDENRKKSKKP